MYGCHDSRNFDGDHGTAAVFKDVLALTAVWIVVMAVVTVVMTVAVAITAFKPLRLQWP